VDERHQENLIHGYLRGENIEIYLFVFLLCFLEYLGELVAQPSPLGAKKSDNLYLIATRGKCGKGACKGIT